MIIMNFNKCILYIFIVILATTSIASAVYNPQMQVDLNWIANTAGSVHSTPILYDVDDDGHKEIIVAASSIVYVFDHTGAVYPGWPQYTGGGTSSSPTIGDIDGDGDIEIALAGAGSKNKYIYLMHHDGSNVAGWPVKLGASPASTVLFSDIDNDGQLELIVGAEGYVYALNPDASIVPGWPKASGSVWAKPAAFDLDGDGMQEIVAASSNGNVYAWNHDGSELWTKYVGEVYMSAPLITNIDQDAEPEIIVATKAGDIYALNHDGSVLAGWPVQTGSLIWYSSPSTADIDGDGDVEIVIGSGSKKVLAFHHDGSAVAGWPRPVSYSVTSQPNLYDIDGNGLPEVVVGCDDGNVYAWNGEGSLLRGWPKMTVPYRWIRGKPAIDDIDNDGVLELIVGSYANKLYSWDMNVLSNPPIAIIGSPSNGSVITAGTPVIFISSSTDEDGYINSYDWTSDKDGAIGNSQSPSVILSSGEHNITLTVVDNDGLMATTSVYLIANSKPTAIINDPVDNSVYPLSSLISFESGSSDIDGTIVSYEWISDKDGIIGTTASFVSSILSSGLHNVTLTVVDDNSASDSAITNFKVNVPPTSTINTPLPDSVYPLNSPISFESGSSDSDGTVTSYKWVSDKDGVIGTNASFESSTLSSGLHNVTLTVVDDNSASDSSITNFKVNVPPTSTINTPLPDSVYLVGSPISFDSGSSDSDGTIVSYEWISDKDGIIGTTASFVSSTLSSGLHNVTLTIIDDNSASDSLITDFKVNIPPVVSITSPVNGAVFGQTDTASFRCSASDEDGYIASYEWQSDIDGLISSTDNFDMSTLSTGIHHINLTVLDEYGAIATDAIVLNQTGYSVEWMVDAFDPGRTVPIKFKIIDPLTGEFVADASAILKIYDSDDAEIFNISVGEGSDYIRIDEDIEQYICNFKVNRSADIGEYTIEVGFDSIRPDQEFATVESIGLLQKAKSIINDFGNYINKDILGNTLTDDVNATDNIVGNAIISNDAKISERSNNVSGSDGTQQPLRTDLVQGPVGLIQKVKGMLSNSVESVKFVTLKLLTWFR